MERNLFKNAHAREQAETTQFVHALERLSEAARLYEGSGNVKKAEELTEIIEILSLKGTNRDLEIKTSIASLEDSIDKMGSLAEDDIDDITGHFLSSADIKIRAVLSQVSETSGNIYETIDTLKRTYQATPGTLSAIAKAVDVAQGTLSAIAKSKSNKPETKKKS